MPRPDIARRLIDPPATFNSAGVEVGVDVMEPMSADEMYTCGADDASPSGSEAMLDRTRTAGWPDALAHRVAAMRMDSNMVQEWLDTGFPPVEGIESFVTDQERLFEGSLRIREATWGDSEVVADLYANAPETVGEFDVFTERSPFPFAQLRLQEHASMILLEERRVGLGVAARSTRNAMVGGRETSVSHMSGWRVRTGHRGKGYARLLQMAPGPGLSWFGLTSYWYVRSGNLAQGWIQRVVDDFEARPAEFVVKGADLTASVAHVSPLSAPADPRIRAAAPADLERCAELINHLTDGLDLVRPITAEFLRTRLDDPSWGPKPPFWAEVYRWPDFNVLEIGGQIVACAGLWDRGRHMRDRWVHRETGRSFINEDTAIIDVGMAPGHVEALGALLAHHASRTGEMGRTSMLVALEHHPDVLAQLADHDVEHETRALNSLPMVMPGLDFDPPTITRPHTDLAYW